MIPQTKAEVLWKRQVALLREALDNSQGLLVAMLHEARPQDEIDRQIVENRAALNAARGGEK
jgi:hypothetical protein